MNLSLSYYTYKLPQSSRPYVARTVQKIFKLQANAINVTSFESVTVRNERTEKIINKAKNRASYVHEAVGWRV